MRIDRIPADTTVHPLGRPIRYAGGEPAVLLLHGWTGWPGRLAYVARSLADAGLTVEVPRLPGHGTSMADLLETRAEDWLRRAVDAYLEIRSEHPVVHVGGASMGAVLAAVIATRFAVPRLALLAPAFRARRRAVAFAPLLQLLVRRVPSDWREAEEADPLSREIGREYATWNYISTVAELRRVQLIGMRSLARLTSETLVVVSKSDGTVAPDVADLIESRSRATRFERLVLESSNHQIGEHLERERVARALVDWFTR